MLRRCILVTMGLLALIGPAARADDRYWVGPSSFWEFGVHWSETPDGDGGAGMPIDGDNAYIVSPANLVVTRDQVTPSYTGTGPAFVMLDGIGPGALVTLRQTANRMAAAGERVGFDGRAQYLQSGGDNVFGNLWLGGNAGSAGTYTLSGALSTASGNFAAVGEGNGAGTFLQTDGTVNVTTLFLAGFGSA